MQLLTFYLPVLKGLLISPSCSQPQRRELGAVTGECLWEGQGRWPISFCYFLPLLSLCLPLSLSVYLSPSRPSPVMSWSGALVSVLGTGVSAASYLPQPPDTSGAPVSAAPVTSRGAEGVKRWRTPGDCGG